MARCCSPSASPGVTYAVRALRWQYLLAPIGPTHFSTAFRTTVIGFAATFLLPARAGEVIRPYLLARREGLNATAAFATIILERLLDLITVLLLFAWFVLTAAPDAVSGDPAQFARVKLGGLAAAGVALAGVGGVLRAGRSPRTYGPAGPQHRACAPGPAGPARRAIRRDVLAGLAVMRQPRRMLIALALSVPLWLAIASGIWLTSQAFHITFPFQASFLVTTVLVVGVAVPTPGGGRRVSPRVSVCGRGVFRRAGRPGRRRGDRAARHFVRPGDAARASTSWRARA